jgi:hypothetical protein
MLDDAYQTGTDAALQDLAMRPKLAPVPQQRFSAWRTLTAAPRGVVAAAGEAMGSTADVIQAFGASSALTLESDPVAIAALGRKKIEEGRVDAQRMIASGEAMTSEIGTSLRAGGQFYQPDPVTAHAAERLVFDFARAGSKVVAGSVVAGPFGIAAAGLEESITQSEALRQQGVDMPTRTIAGAIQGTALAAGAAIPMAGTTALGTAGLVIAGGPASFMAQQQATRSILENAGYAEIAGQYDPFDPVGLAVSTLIPAGFGAYGLRASRMRAAAEVKAADAARMAAPEPPSELTPVAAAAKATASQEMVDAARVSLMVEQRRAGSLADPHDIQATARDANALTRAEEQMARGERVNVTDLAPINPPRAVFSAVDQMIAGLEETRSDLVARAADLAGPGEIRAARQELTETRSQRPDDSDAATRNLAKTIQEVEGVSYKTALADAKKTIGGQLADWEARVGRLEQTIERNARAQQAVQELPRVDQQIAAAREAPVLEAPAEPPAAAVSAMERLAAGDTPAAIKIAQEALGRPPGEMQPQQALLARPQGDGARPAGDDAARVAELEQTAPHALDAQIATGWNDKGEITERMSARDYLAAVQRAAAAETADAELLQVAVMCALRAG